MIKMKLFFQLVTCIGLLSVTTVNAQSFEGVIEMRTFNGELKDEATVSWSAKKGNHRLDITGTSEGKPYNLTLMFLNNEPNVKMLSDVNGEQSLFSVPISSISSKQIDGAISKTNDVKDVAGVSCTLYNIVTSNGITSVWLAEQLAYDLKFPPSLQSFGIMGVLNANNIIGIPMEISAVGEGGIIAYSQTVTNIKESVIAESQFEVPSSYEIGKDLNQK